MNRNVPLIITLTLLLALPGFAGDRKKHANRAMIEKMDAVPCGASEHGLSGLGSLWASVGVTHIKSDEKLCRNICFAPTTWSTRCDRLVKSIPFSFRWDRRANSS